MTRARPYAVHRLVGRRAHLGRGRQGEERTRSAPSAVSAPAARLLVDRQAHEDAFLFEHQAQGSRGRRPAGRQGRARTT